MGANKSLEEMCIANKNISSLVIDRLSDRIDEDTVSVVYLYRNFQAQKSQVTAHSMLASHLKQVVDKSEFILVEIDRAFQSKTGLQ